MYMSIVAGEKWEYWEYGYVCLETYSTRV